MSGLGDRLKAKRIYENDMRREKVEAMHLAEGLVERLEELLGRISTIRVVTGKPDVDYQIKMKRAIAIVRSVAEELENELG